MPVMSSMWVYVLLLSISMAVFDAVANMGNGRVLLLTGLVQG